MNTTRAGEVRTTLPADFDAAVYFIGRIRTPWHERAACPRNGNGSDAVCRVEVDPRYAAGLAGVDRFSHLVLLYWMHDADRDLVVQSPRHHEGRRGTFGLRSPARPNPIALSTVRLIGIDGCTLAVQGLDCLDGTALLDIKPYLPSVDSRPDATGGWAPSASEKARPDVDGERQHRRVEEEGQDRVGEHEPPHA